MKYSILFLFLYPLFSFAQGDAVPMKRANKIIVTNDKTTRENFVHLQEILLQKGYTVSINRSTFTVQTKDSLLSEGNILYSLKGQAQGDSVILTGQYHSIVESSMLGGRPMEFSYEISNIGGRSSVSKKLFGFLDETAKAVGGKLIYLREKKKRNGVIF